MLDTTILFLILPALPLSHLVIMCIMATRWTTIRTITLVIWVRRTLAVTSLTLRHQYRLFLPTDLPRRHQVVCGPTMLPCRCITFPTRMRTPVTDILTSTMLTDFIPTSKTSLTFRPSRSKASCSQGQMICCSLMLVWGLPGDSYVPDTVVLIFPYFRRSAVIAHCYTVHVAALC